MTDIQEIIDKEYKIAKELDDKHKLLMKKWKGISIPKSKDRICYVCGHGFDNKTHICKLSPLL